MKSVEILENGGFELNTTTSKLRSPFVHVPKAWLRLLKPQEGWVAVALAAMADENGCSTPSQRELCAWTGLSKPSVIRAIDRLEKLGIVTVEPRRYADGATASNLYRIHLVPPTYA
jgi:hypothetical protein